MNLFDRFILTLYSLALTVLSVIVMAAAAGFIPYSIALANVQAMYNSGEIRYAYIAVAFIFFVISLKFLIPRFGPKQERGHKEAISQMMPLGHLSISTNTIDSIALKSARRVRGVKEVKNVIKSDETGTSILLKVAVDGETPIPTLVEELQKNVKEQVEAIIGITVKQIDVKITEVAQQPSTRLSRVE